MAMLKLLIAFGATLIGMIRNYTSAEACSGSTIGKHNNDRTGLFFYFFRQWVHSTHPDTSMDIHVHHYVHCK
jgi:hypothetical protein